MEHIKKLIEKDLTDKLDQMIGGLEINYSTQPVYFKVEPISENMIVDVVNRYDEDFEYLDCNGVDKDWNHTIVKNDMEIHLWGSVTDAICCLQSTKV